MDAIVDFLGFHVLGCVLQGKKILMLPLQAQEIHKNAISQYHV